MNGVRIDVWVLITLLLLVAIVALLLTDNDGKASILTFAMIASAIMGHKQP